MWVFAINSDSGWSTRLSGRIRKWAQGLMIRGVPDAAGKKVRVIAQVGDGSVNHRACSPVSASIAGKGF